MCTWESSDRGQALFASIITLPWGASGGAEFVSATIMTHYHTNQNKKLLKETKHVLFCEVMLYISQSKYEHKKDK